jgi:hypothetical protein
MQALPLLLCFGAAFLGVSHSALGLAFEDLCIAEKPLYPLEALHTSLGCSLNLFLAPSEASGGKGTRNLSLKQRNFGGLKKCLLGTKEQEVKV